MLSVCDLAHTGSPLPLHGTMRSGSLLLACGVVCMDGLYTLFVQEAAKFGFLLSLRSFAQSGPLVLALSFATLESSFPVQSSVWIGLAVPVLGVAQLSLSVSIPDSTTFGPSSPLQSSANAGFHLLVLNFATPDFSMSLHGLA